MTFEFLYELTIFSKLVSSTKWYVKEFFIESFRSLMYRRNRRGPRTEPWGTPCSIFDSLELKPLIDTNCLRSLR